MHGWRWACNVRNQKSVQKCSVDTCGPYFCGLRWCPKFVLSLDSTGVLWGPVERCGHYFVAFLRTVEWVVGLSNRDTSPITTGHGLSL